MLWSLIKILLFVALVGALAYGGVYLMDSSGGVQVTVAGTEYTLGPLQSVIAAIALVFAVWVLLKLLGLGVAIFKFLNGDETALSRYFDRNRERKGYAALTEGMMALASGEGRVAASKAARAEKYLCKPELTNLLIAQAAEMTGDRRKAEETYKKLIMNDSTRFVGVRGILHQKISAGETEVARQLAQKAHDLRPRHEETQNVLLNLQTQANDWAGARKTLTAKLKHGSMPRDLYTRRDAVLALSEANDLLADEATVDMQEKAIAANKKSPDLIPAAVMAARAHIAAGSARAATKVLKKAWGAQPHPDLAAAFAQIVPDETPDKRIKRFAALTRQHPDNPETKLLLSELHIAAEDFPEARRAMGDLLDHGPDARAYTLMAAIERGEGADDKVVGSWLARALSAPRGPQWICDSCHHIHADWAPICEHCNSFDTLSWTTPPKPEVSTMTGLEMLPLLIGGADETQEPSEESDIVEAELLEADETDIDVAEADAEDSPEEVSQDAAAGDDAEDVEKRA